MVDNILLQRLLVHNLQYEVVKIILYTLVVDINFNQVHKLLR